MDCLRPWLRPGIIRWVAIFEGEIRKLNVFSGGAARR